MMITVVIVSWNTRELLDKCLASLKIELSSNLLSDQAETFVVDNMSNDDSADMVAAKYPWVKLICNDKNRGFAAANNQVLSVAKGQYILLLNPDTEIVPGALAKLIQFLEQLPDAGVVAPQLLNSDGSIQRSCRQFPTFWGMFFELVGFSRLMPNVHKFREYKMLDWNHNDERQVDQPEGACLLIRKAVLDEIGFLDEGYFMLFEEVDWCYRAKAAGWQIWFTPAAKIIHHYGQSIKQVKIPMILSSHRGLYRYWCKHHKNGRWYLDSLAYLSLMLLAYLRISCYWLRTQIAAVGSTTQPN